MVDMFPMRRRAWPYKMEFACAWHGFWLDGQHLRRAHGFQQNWWAGNGIDTQIKSQAGRFVLERKLRQCVDSEGVIIPGPVDRPSCEALDGLWRWDGIPYLTPSIDMIVPDYEDCNKYPGAPNWSKILTVFGFWFPKRSFCVDPATLLILPPSSPGTCSAGGGVWQDDETILRPPLWRGAWRTSIGTFPTTNLGETNLDWPGANEYQWLVLLPVEPLSAFPPECCNTGCVPYCNEPNAPALFPFKENFTYEIPNYSRDWDNGGVPVSGEPWRNVSFGQISPSVPAGVLGIVAQSGSSARPGNLQVYCLVAGQFGCPQNAGCDAAYCEDAFENIWRRYRGITEQKRYIWTDDPYDRGWWVEYITEISAWFAQDAYWTALVIPRPIQRWSAWYTGQTRARWPAAAADMPDDFRAWILTHDSGFGIDFQPRYAACNDVLAKHEGLYQALGDQIYPPEGAQDVCNLNGPPPCRAAGFGYGSWYRLTGSTPAPEQGLYHETVRKRWVTPPPPPPLGEPAPHPPGPQQAVDPFITEYGWAKLAFTTSPPCLIAA